MKTEENNLKMAKGRIATSSTRQTASSKPKFKRFSENERLKAITQEISITLSPCDLLTSIDCNFAAKMKDVSDKESCGSADKGTALDCHYVKDDDDSRQCSRTSDQTQNIMDTGTDSNISDSDFGSPNSGFRPTSFYGSQKQNLSVRIKPIVQNTSVKSGEDHHEVKSKNVCGVKRKHKKQSSSTAAKKKPKTGIDGRCGKGFGKKDKCPLQSASLSIQEDKSHVNRLVNINKVTQPGHLTEVDDLVTKGFQCIGESLSEGINTSKQSSQESPESLSDSLVEGFIPLRAKSAFISQTVAISEAESACSEESLLSGPGSVLDGLFLKKKGNEYFFTESIDSSAANIDQIACKENGINESAEGISTGSGSDASSVVDQNVSLIVKGPDSDLTDTSQSSFTLSMPSPETSESEFGSKLLSTEAESESTSPRGTSPEHQASIKRYFKSIPGPKCKTKLGVNGTVLPAAAESSLETKSRTTPPRKKKAGKRQEQMYLDLGQRDFGHVTCPTCGMVYTRAQPDDEAAHIKHHKSFVSGLRFHGWKNECVLQEYHDGRVIMVGPDDHPLHLKKVEEVRKVVDSELGFVADVTCRRSEVKTFLFIAIKKVVGCAVAVQIDQGYPVLPSPGGSSTLSPEKQIAAWCCSTTPQSAQCGISRIWVHNQYRRKKIATRLLDCVRMNFIYGCIIPRELVAFSDPTPHGKLLAKSYAGTSQFLVFR